MVNPNAAHLTLVVDRSGSMQSVRDDAQGGINTLLAEQFAAPARLLTVTLVEFDDDIDTVARMATTAPRYELVPKGCTRLLDAVGAEIVRTGQDLAALPEHDRPERVLFVVVTDGMENASKEFTLEQVRAAVEHQRAAYAWQFQFIGADAAAWQGADMGMASARYAPTATGTRAAYRAASAAIRDYLEAPLPAAFAMPSVIEDDPR